MVRRSALLAALAAVAVAGPAAAAAPERFEFDEQESDSIDCSVFN